MNNNVSTVDESESVIDLVQMLNALWKRLWIIVIVTVVGGALAFLLTFFFIEPKYQSSAMMYVNNSDLNVGSTSINLSDLTAAQGLISTYSVILNSRGTLELVIAQSGVDYSYEELKKMITCVAVNDTEVFEITVTSTDPEEAELIANTIVRVLPNRIDAIIKGSAVEIVDYAIVPQNSVSPSYKKNTLIGCLLAAVLCCAVIIVRELLDTVIHSEDYLLKTYPEVPLLAVVAAFGEDDKSGKRGYYYAARPKGK